MEPASIRFKNPGAMWGHTGKHETKRVRTNVAIPLKWGSVWTTYLGDGLGQGNNIAEFDTWVDGICAQLDLWRSSPKYKNKRFADAIHIWDGGNNTPSYIAYVTGGKNPRVPGMTADTIMNDAFWSGPMAIPFLKAQSGHEAGKPIPAPDADWIEAQRRVMSGYVRVPTAAKNVQIPTATVDSELKTYQSALIAFGYFEVGEPDGRIGGKTSGALKAFSTDRGYTHTLQYPSADLTREIAAARAEKWMRPIAPSRAYAKEDDIKKSVASVEPTRSAGFFSKIATYLGIGGSAVKGAVYFLPDANDQVSTYSSIVKEYLDIPAWVILLVVGLVALFIWRETNRAKAATIADYQKGKIN